MKRSLKVPNLFISTGRDSFWQAITAAKRAASISRMEQEKTSRIHILLNASKEGLLSVDSINRIRMVNQAARKILNISEPITGMKVMDAPFTRQFKKLLLEDSICTNEIFKYKDTMLNVTKYPIMVQNVNMGIVVSFQKVNDIVDLEQNIRQKIHNKGHIAKACFDDIQGCSRTIIKTVETAKKFSITDSNILLIGQSGTGKELFAQSIHNYSPRKNAPFVAVNCAAIPESLLESELFGYTSGAFTGAQKNGKPGYFELAHNGTLFLDEIGEIPLHFQAKLLRAIQERQIMRLGSDRLISVNIRIIAATNRNLEQLVENETFREDLFYRLDVLRITLPSLCERREDIPVLVQSWFLSHAPEAHVSPAACLLLSKAKWNGNIRQLFNICERLSVLNSTGEISEDDVYSLLPELNSEIASTQKLDNFSKKEFLSAELCKESFGKSLEFNEEKILFLKALEASQYNRGKAASLLGISRTTLWRKMKELGI